MITRRAFINGVGAITLASPLATEAQQAGKVYRIGLIANAPAKVEDALYEELRARGYVEGRNLLVTRRYSEGKAERFQELAAEMVGLKVDVIVVFTTPAALAAKNATRTIPIVFPTAIDPVGNGVVASLAQPGGNITGGAILFGELSPKRLQLLKEVVPKLTRVAVLWNAANPANAAVWTASEHAARALGLTLRPHQVRGPGDFDRVFVSITSERPEAIHVLADSLTFQFRQQISDFATRQRLPGVFDVKEMAEAGGLISYGPNVAEMLRRGAYYVDRILKGAKPAELPLEQPTKFELVINLKAAKALGLTIPQSLLLRADQLIE